MRRLPDWRESLPSHQPKPVEPPPPSLPKPHEREFLHPVSDHAEWLRRETALDRVPYEPPTSLDVGKAVIPFHYVSGHNRERHVHAERAVEADRRRATVARKAHEARLAEPWPEGEWCDLAAVGHARPSPTSDRDREAMVRQWERDTARERERQRLRRVEREERIAWCEAALPERWPDEAAAGWCDLGDGGFHDDATWEWCNVEAIAWCLDSGGGWCEGDRGGWEDDPEGAWCGDEDLDGLLALAWAEWRAEDREAGNSVKSPAQPLINVLQ